MKVVKFKKHFISEILSGSKNTTWRLFDDKDLSVGDEIELVEKESLSKFGEAKIVDIVNKNIEELSPQELLEHGYDNVNRMIEGHKLYYGDQVDLKTQVKIIQFELHK